MSGVTHADDLRPECMWGLHMQAIGVRNACWGYACRRLECGVHLGVKHAGDWSAECIWGLSMQAIGVRNTCGGCACRGLELGGGMYRGYS